MNAPTIRDIAGLYLQYCKSNNIHTVASRSQREYRLGQLIQAIGDIPVSELKPFHLVNVIETQSRVRSSSTRRCFANMAKAMMNWACRQGYISTNPFQGVQYEESEPRSPMPVEIFNQLCSQASKPFERAIRFLRVSGCRLSELCRLTWDSIDFDRGIAVLKLHKSRRRTKRPRVLVLTPSAIELLQSIRANQPKDYVGPVFLNTRGQPWSKATLGQTFYRLKRSGAIKTNLSLHCIRHLFAHSAIARGASIGLISHALGHAQVSTTAAFYAHIGDNLDAVRKAAAMSLEEPETNVC